jgi:hypothetical protein
VAVPEAAASRSPGATRAERAISSDDERARLGIIDLLVARKSESSRRADAGADPRADVDAVALRHGVAGLVVGSA